MADEALDAVGGTRIGTGIHLVATATICSKGASLAELELAKAILLRDPKRALPREIAGSIETFNRHMDAAIESCNDSASEPTRAGRRARLASDLERAGLLLIEQSVLAELLSRSLAGDDFPEGPAPDPFYGLDTFPEEEDGLDEGEEIGLEFGAELAASASATSLELGTLGLEFGAAEGVTFLTHTPSLDVGEPVLGYEELAELVDRINGTPNLQPWASATAYEPLTVAVTAASSSSFAGSSGTGSATRTGVND